MLPNASTDGYAATNFPLGGDMHCGYQATLAGLILSINAGSSSLKYALYEAGAEERPVLSAAVSGLTGRPVLTIKRGDTAEVPEELSTEAMAATDALGLVLARLAADGLLSAVCAVGHRIVHGGTNYVSPTRLDSEVLTDLRQLSPLAPVHQEVNLDCAELAMAAVAPAIHVGCFDTAFHSDQPRLARLYALPRDLTAQGLQSYGFHGLSFASISGRLEGLIGERARGRVVVAHLGSGASLCAIYEGRSIATTMGLTPLDGLPMSTRSGALDPGLVLHLILDRGMAPEDVRELLLHRSGLLGVSGLSGDMRELLASGASDAKEAVELFVYRAGRAIGSLVAALGGLDVLVFTAGIGESAPEIRRRVCDAAAWLDVRLDEPRNAGGDLVISSPDSKVQVLVIPTDEQATIVQLTKQHLLRGVAPDQG